jgi:hypothetical protein
MPSTVIMHKQNNQNGEGDAGSLAYGSSKAAVLWGLFIGSSSGDPRSNVSYVSVPVLFVGSRRDIRPVVEKLLIIHQSIISN